MGSFIHVYTDGGGIRECRVPDDFSGGDSMLTTIDFSAFRRCLFASLVVNSTASRTSDIVTITATAHGITTGSTYVGYRFFYPGSAGLAAGWYDSILSIPDANTITFSAPGANFGSQSINSAAAYTTLTVMAGSAIVPANTFKDGASLSISMYRGGGSDAGTKISRLRYGGAVLGAYAATTPCMLCARHTIFCPTANKQLGCNGVDSIVGNTRYEVTVDATVDQVLDMTLQLSAAGSFMTMDALHVEIVR